MDSMLRTDLGHGLPFDSAQAVQKARLAGQNLSKRFGKSDRLFSNKRRVDIMLELKGYFSHSLFSQLFLLLVIGFQFVFVISIPAHMRIACQAFPLVFSARYFYINQSKSLMKIERFIVNFLRLKHPAFIYCVIFCLCI